MRTTTTLLLISAAVLVAAPLRADDVCSQEERRTADAGLARAQAAEKAGDLPGALRLANSNDVRNCGDYKVAQSLVTRVAGRLGKDAEAAGKLAAAFDYFEQGALHDDARRVGMKQLTADPKNRQLASNLLGFMQRHEFADSVRVLQDHARDQAERLLAEEAKTHAVRSPRRELLDEARDWLRVAGDEPAASVAARAVKRGDEYAALDYAYALQQALAYYSFAGRADKEPSVRTKARGLADKLAGGKDWATAAELYEIAGDSKRARELRASREADAATAEKNRQEQFKKEQDDLEKELDL
jgi:hypothetical protein